MPKSFDTVSLRLALLAIALSVPPIARAERTDRDKPLTVAADRQGTIDMQKQIAVFTGNVVLTKGTLVIRAERVEVREGRDGFRIATATGAGGKPATLRQKRDGVDEFIDGRADRLEYEERDELVRFVNDAVVRRLRGNAVADEITGNLISYNGTTEVFNVSAGTADGRAAAPGLGRVQAILAPRNGSEAALAQSAAAASDPARRAPATGSPR